MTKRERRRFEKRRARERKIRKLQNMQRRNNVRQSYFSTQTEREVARRRRQLKRASTKQLRRLAKW